jgi:hypothetical protein
VFSSERKPHFKTFKMVLERTKIWPWVMKPGVTVLMMANNSLLLCALRLQWVNGFKIL